MRGEFVFTVSLWAAVFSVAAGIVALPGIPLKTRYAAGLAAVAYLYLYAELSRLRSPLRLRRLLLTVADAGIVVGLGWLSAPYTGYAHLLVFFAAARIAVRFTSPLVLPLGLALLLPFDLPGLTGGIGPVLDVFGGDDPDARPAAAPGDLPRRPGPARPAGSHGRPDLGPGALPR